MIVCSNTPAKQCANVW